MRKLLLFLACLALATPLPAPAAAMQPATALTSPLPGDISLGFNAAYQLGDKTRYHTGVDISGSAGDTVKSAGGGSVTFTGHIPPVAEAGSHVLAVTVKHEDGRLVTYFPLQSSSVTKGARVSRGDPIGLLAEIGDASSPRPHLHVGVRENGNYIDPEPLSPLVTAQASTPDEAAETAPRQAAAAAPGARVRHRAAKGAAPVSSLASRVSAARGPAVLRRAPAAHPRAACGRFVQSGQEWLHSRLLRANRPEAWIDPALLSPAPAKPAPSRPSHTALPASPARPFGLLLLSASLAIAAALLGRIKPVRVSTPAMSAQGAGR